MQGTSAQNSLQESKRAYANQFGKTFSNQCARFMLEPVDMSPDDYILDVATGPGTAIFESLCKTDAPPAFAGVDASYEMLHGANSILEAMWSKTNLNIEFLYGDVHRLSFEDNTFETVFSNLGIHLFSRRTVAISEMKRVLKPGGTIALTIPYLIPESYRFTPPIHFDEEAGDWTIDLSELSGKQNTIIGEILDELKIDGFSDLQTADKIVPYACSGAQEVIGLLKTVLHFSGRLPSSDRMRAFAILDRLLYSLPMWEEANTYAVNLGVTRILCVK